MLEAYDYPGNIRELENIIASTVVLENGNTLTKRSLPPYLVKSVAHHQAPVPKNARKTLAELEADHIRRIMEHTNGNLTVAARILGISRAGLLSKMKRIGIEVEPPARGGGQHRNRGTPNDEKTTRSS